MHDFLSRTEPQFVSICRFEELIDGKGREFMVNETEIAVFRVKDQVFALHNICIHQHQAILHDGFIEDGFVVCPAHAWQFRLKDGKQPGNKCGVQCYPVELRGGEVYVKVNQKRFCF
jgi:NAD(P)H-dependent nitrite reductase small subunit